MNYNNNFKVPFLPEPILRSELGKGRVFTLRGPRQVGKTRFLKNLKEKAKDLNPVYESLDLIRTERELAVFVKKLIKDTKTKLLLLDEITSVSKWQKAIKYLIDKDEIKGIDLILSGSSATDIKRGAERLPGRRGAEIEGGWDRILLPLNFFQFIKHNAFLSEDDLIEIGDKFEAPELLNKEIHCKLKSSFDNFIKTGGFPLSILAAQNNDPPPYRTMMAIIRSDFEKRKKSRIILDQVLSRLTEVSGGAVTWEAFAKTVTATKVITRQYIDELCENYLVADIECIDLGRGKTAPRKPRKLYFIDPLIPTAILDDELGIAVSEAAIVESLVAFELMRKHEKNLWEGLNQVRNVNLWRDSRGGEIDFVIHNIDAVEIKWQNEVSPWDAVQLNKTFGKGTLLCKSKFAKFGNVNVMPVYWYLLQEHERL